MAPAAWGLVPMGAAPRLPVMRRCSSTRRLTSAMVLPLLSAKMRTGRLGWVALLAIGVSGAGCFPKAGAAPPAPSAAGVSWAAARWPGASAASLSTGRDHFLAKCNGCHSYPDLASISEGSWPAIVERMAKKAGLQGEQGTAVLQFVLTARSEQAGR